MPTEPLIFLKPPSALIGPEQPVVLPAASQQVEEEAEIGVVVLERIRGITPEAAATARIGFTCVNDVTARDLQKRDGQWTRAKGFDTFCPVGPAVVEGLDWRGLEVIGRVNGRVVQR
ncbi:MAG TPA: fumarylacetoacetate hydrolase family protein, partial [Gemmatimonadales bacterium]|nr:fumarylacetoacetate hydrolase family protein [Gemmatimonadales bacterium]